MKNEPLFPPFYSHVIGYARRFKPYDLAVPFIAAGISTKKLRCKVSTEVRAFWTMSYAIMARNGSEGAQKKGTYHTVTKI